MDKSELLAVEFIGLHLPVSFECQISMFQKRCNGRVLQWQALTTSWFLKKDIFIKAVLHLILDKKIRKIDKGLGMDVINVVFPMKF